MTSGNARRQNRRRAPHPPPRLRLRSRTAARLACLTGAALAAGAAQAAAFGTVNGFFGQNGEHERITRAALACAAGVRSDGNCFEASSVTEVAGQPLGGFGAVGIPDFPPPAGSESHCDDADFLDTTLYPRIPGRYPQTRARADAELDACRTEMVSRFRRARTAANLLVNPNGHINAAEISTFCLFLGNITGTAKCNVFDEFGRSLHGVQDFYSHSNWSDAPVPDDQVTIDNPPGMGRRTLSPFLDMRLVGPPAIPRLLLTGCFSVYEKGLSPFDGCTDRNGVRRVRHAEMNKDQGTIDPVSGAASAPTTPRGQTATNFADAVSLAIQDTRRQWRDLRQEIVSAYGPARGSLMVCALTRDDPVKDCQGRTIGLVIDSSGSNTTTDPGNLRITAAAAFNDGLVSTAEAGGDGTPDRVAVIDFDDAARVASPLGDPDGARFDSIDSSGGTNIAGGVNLAVDELTRDPADAAAGHAGIVVLTDGQDSDVAALVQAIARAGGLGIRVNFGFLSPPENPVAAARARRGTGRQMQTRTAPSPDLVAAIIATGGVFSTIDSASAQRAFIDLVRRRGATGMDDPNGGDDGGPLASGASTTALAQLGATDTFSYAATRGRILTLHVRGLAGQRLAVVVRDVATGATLSRTSTRSNGTVGIQARLRRSHLLEVDVTPAFTAGPYSVDLAETGVDRLGTGRADRITCRPGPNYVDGGGGADRIACGGGDDMISAGPGADSVSAGGGDDVILVARGDRHRGTETVSGGPGTDVVEFQAGRPRAVPIPRGRQVVVDTGGGRFVLTGVEVVRFGSRTP